MRALILLLLFFASCNNSGEKKKDMESKYQLTGTLERIDPALDAVIAEGTKAEIIAEGFEWSEGPLWVEKENMLIFSDVPRNTIYKWTAEKGKEIYLEPSGYTDSADSKRKEPGSNGLVLDGEGRLVLCQHGDRRMARMDAPLNKPQPVFTTVADSYQGKRLSSPNDCAYFGTDLYFTDPPYGLPRQNDDDPLKETPVNGVYAVNRDGEVRLIADSLSRPNGLAFFDDGSFLVANCDPNDPTWYIIKEGTSPTGGKGDVFYSVKGYDKSLKGLPDGLKIDNKRGIVYATGPGGLYILDRNGKLLGRLLLDNPASNCALSPDGKMLYITNDMYLLRLALK